MHSFLKDPAGGLDRNFGQQSHMFLGLLKELKLYLPVDTMPSAAWYAALAQLAQESSYLAIPLLRSISYIYFHEHLQLTYIYLRINQLQRTEFSDPGRVLQFITQLVSEACQHATVRLVPILISSCPSLDQRGLPHTIILDGNNRIAALTLLQYISSGEDADFDHSKLAVLCAQHAIDARWTADLQTCLQSLRENTSLRDFLTQKRAVLQYFTAAMEVPALLAQESDFHTIFVGTEGSRSSGILRPAIQTVLADKMCPVGFPSKGQRHGRPIGYLPLPLRREGLREMA